MTEKPASYQVQDAMVEDPPSAIAERDKLLAECQRLLFQVSRRPGAIKLLIGVKGQLKMFSAYKSNRVSRKSKRKKVGKNGRSSN